jgi:hypothetical protein
MSTRVEAPPIEGSFAGPILIAIVAAFVVGALMGTVVTKVVNDRLAASSGVAPARPLVVTPVGAPSWDARKLQEMKGHQLAEQSRTEAMEDHQLAEAVHRHRPVGGPLG